MEVATTNNHSQSHHHHHHHLQAVAAVAAQSHGSVGVGGGGGVSGSGSRSPFQREVREWQRIDPNTGALFSGRLEADRWINGPLNSYGKISDSQNISQPNGTQHTQRKQLEVLKARTANGAMQVIRTQTVQKTSSTSTSRGWATSSTSTTTRTSNGHLGSSTDPSPPSHMPSIWAPPSISRPSSQSVDICELSDDNSSLSGSLSSDVGIVSPSASASAAMSTLSKRNGQELIDDHVDFVVINGEASDQDADDVVVAHLHKLGHNLLPDTAPSLKLSNLMKSSSSISSQSSNNSNLTTATATAGNTHRSAGKISLHAIVGPESSSSTTSTSTPSLSLSSAWAKQQQQQADLYGQPPASSSSSRVGVSQAQPQPGTGAGAGSDADVAVVVGSTPTRLRRDLESFRHYNDDAANDDDLRLSARHQRRQQVSQSVYAPPLASIGTGLGLQRSRSISTDDLSNDWERNEEQEQEPGEWRRVSKLRRSFQSQDHYKTATKTSTITRPRPLDLPSNSVSVARMRAELENGRRLNTAMRNNHVDLAALDTILNNPQQTTKPTVAKRNTFLTAESLQEIRGKLKKLSDESLYKEDFLAYHQARPKLREQSEELHVPVQVAAPLPAPSAFRPVHNTHSLESRQRQKDTSSSEWHLRRKSYGFEKMSPPEDKSIFRVDASTDSGLGRSGEQLGNWSPTERERERTAAAAAATAHLNNGGGTIIHFGRLPKPPASPANEGELSKRHSIAVEETWRDIRKTSQVHVNGGTVATTSTSTTNSSSHLQRSSAQKRVEFCKTEVHFAAESGRVNIVETDGKPPPTNNFRRRRRTTASGPLQSLVKSASAGTNSSSSSSTSSSTSHDNVTHFGDDPQRRKTIATSTVAYRATLMDPPEVVSQPTSTSTATSSQVTVTTLAKPVLEPRFSLTESTSRNSYTSTSGVDTTDNETDELSNIRGILKNKPVKPKPYHLGENIESADVLWSVPAMKGERESPSGRDSGITSDSPISVKSVAERIRIVEQRQQNQKQPSPAGNGYSTKINVSLGTDEWPESDLPKSNVMNIALHSPRVEKPKATPPTLRIGQFIPVAKPRTLFIQPQPTSVETPGDESGSESLKIVKEARGARKLREHELSYFGVQQQQQQKQQQTKLASPCTNPRRTLPSRSKLSHSDEVAPTTTTTKWQLLNDRPDLLRHSPQDNDYEDDDDDDDDEHCYENIANELTTTFRVKSPSPSPSRSRSPGSYERKTDLQRDAQILSEMTRNADQTLKALSDEAAIKDQRRRSCSLQRRSGKPLETIDEKVNKVHNGDRQSLSVARGTFASEARRNSRQSTPSPTPTRARSSSQSSIECCPRDRSRSSSRESNTQGAGSSDDQASKHRAERLRMRTPKREKSRHEHLEHRSSRHTHASKPRSSSSATAHAAVATSSLEPKRSSHHSSHRHREVEHSSESKHSSGSRLLRSSRVSDESRSRQSALRERERERDRERSRGSEKHREELTRSRGHSSRSRPSSEQAAQAAGTRESSRPSKTRSSRSSHETTIAHKKSTSAAAKSSKSTTHKPSAITTTTTTTTSTSTNNTTATTPSTHNELTYVYVTNLAHTKSGEESEAEANEINADTDADANGDYASIEEISNASPMVPLPPPRRKRKRSLIPVPVQPTASYEYRTKLEMIPPSYSNQSTLRCRSIARHGMKKPSLKATQSTSSSFAFLPYLPAKRNSSVSHVYDNYLLYTAAGGASASASQKLPKLRPYQNNLSNDHAQLFGGTAGTGAGAATRGPGRLGGWPKRLRMRQVRSSVSTHQPFGICTCS
ncbi:serine-rich adhesin for platelets isoform X4 [Drosophila pseudoobscura]|uniref:Serine-rich adhesin for platelets isoform X4 n=1 Tax=Drosophila pseudoobscura pseudoobscura TaxID=46245 RepID=A0A6I8W0A2_DROPS|nr:serine-rich adhesin for platelets isoform X4 [Drosophila pseudoobscura]